MPAFHISPKWTKLFGLGPGVFAQGGIDWLLRDEFITAEGPPLASPRTCEPGPGTLTVAELNGATISIAGDEVNMTGNGISYLDCQLYTAVAFPVVAGLMASFDFIYIATPSSYFVFGFHNTTPHGGDWPLAGWHTYTSVSPRVAMGMSLYNVTSGATYGTLYVVLTAAGALWFQKISGTIKLIFQTTTLPTAITTPKIFLSRHTANLGRGGFIRVRQLPAPFDTDYGIAALDVNPGVSGTLYTAVANAIHDLAVTAPNPLANTCELRYRVLDDNNYWTAYFDATGAFKLDSVSGGVATNRISVAAVATAGNTYTIRVLCDGTKHNCYTLSGTTWTKRGSEVNVSHQDSQTTVKPVAGTGWTLGRLTSWPRTSAAYAELDKV